jgi:hypothetical protein
MRETQIWFQKPNVKCNSLEFQYTVDQLHRKGLLNKPEVVVVLLPECG